MHQTYLTAFRRFLNQGMTHEEAANEFDPDRLQQAINSELAVGDKNWPLFDLCVMASFQRRNRLDWENQAVPLLLAGWVIETPDGHKHNSKDFWRQGQVMSLYWRRPAKREGKRGRLFLSTNQAYNAMMCEAK